MKKRVIFRAPLFTQSGYGVHARQIARFLMSIDDVDLRVQPLHWGSTPWYAVGPCHKIDELRERIDTNPTGYDASFQLQLPNEWDPKIARINVGITAAVETDLAPALWAKRCDEMTSVIVPSAHAQRSLTAAGADHRKISVVPESFPDALIASAQAESLDIPAPPDAFGVLIVGQLTGLTADTDRKNIFSAIRWTREALRGKNAVIIIKTNCGRNTAIDRQKTIAVLRDQAKLGEHGPRVILVHGSLSDTSMRALYKHPAVKCYVSLTRGEGFGLPTLEAAACDVPVIATDWSAHKEYLDAGKWTRVQCDVVKIPDRKIDGSIFVSGAKWAEPSELSFKTKLIKTYDSLRVPQDWARELGVIIRQRYSERAVCEKFLAAVGDTLC